MPHPLNKFDLIVAGSTAPGIVAAVRAAREGLSVALVSAGARLGGSPPSLGAVETHYRGNRESGQNGQAHGGFRKLS